MRRTKNDLLSESEKRRLQKWQTSFDGVRMTTCVRARATATRSESRACPDSILAAVQNALRQFVPSEWADEPHMRVSDLTRETLRRMLTVFMATGAKRPDGSSYAGPFQHQGTGTINTLVLAPLSLTADQKQNVIFAMEEPEIAIPPHTQKRIVNTVKTKSARSCQWCSVDT